MRELIDELKEFGLSEKEAAVYLAVLELGQGTAQEIAEQAMIPRPTTYLALESLTKERLIRLTNCNNKKVFLARPPEALQSLILRKRQQLIDEENNLKRNLPRLMALFSRESRRPQVRCIEGEKGLKIVQQMFHAQKGDAFQIVPYDLIEEKVKLRDQTASLERFVLEGNLLRVLLVAKKQVREEPLAGTEIRVMPYLQFPVDAEITVRGNNAYLHSFNDDFLSVIITSKEIITTIKALFELAWLGAENVQFKKVWE